MTISRPGISFDNTEIAFAYKSNGALKKAKFLFYTMGAGWLVRLGTRLTPLAMRLGLPVNALIRNTIFEQFVGGETLAHTQPVAEKLRGFNVQVILDYGVEGKKGEASFDQACEEFIRVINYAASQPNIPFMSIKVTGLARFELLDKLNTAAAVNYGSKGLVAVEALNAEEVKEWERVVQRMQKIVAVAALHQVGVLVDAEESWIQDPVDALTMRMMEKFNTTRAVVYNTIQLYRRDRLAFLTDSHQQAQKNNFIYGVKLVRGAYMEKERARAAARNYPSPIQPDKSSTDHDYDEAVRYCIANVETIATIIASHNEHSNILAFEQLQQHKLPLNHPRVHFSQLYGMSDNVTFNLAKAGCSVSKYLPFGPIKDVVPYLMRRAHENSSLSGHTGRELALIKTEIRRRGL